MFLRRDRLKNFNCEDLERLEKIKLEEANPYVKIFKETEKNMLKRNENSKKIIEAREGKKKGNSNYKYRRNMESIDEKKSTRKNVQRIERGIKKETFQRPAVNKSQ